MVSKLIGQRFGKLIVLEKLPIEKGKNPKFRCKCDCGNIIDVFQANLCNGNTIACGCQRGEQHHESTTKEYRRYQWTKKMGCDFKSYSDFKSWLIDNGWYAGCDFHIKRIDTKQPFSRENAICTVE